MSIIFEHGNSVLVSHNKIIDRFYSCVENEIYCIRSDIFNIITPYKSSNRPRRKLKPLVSNKDMLRKEIDTVKKQYICFLEKLYSNNILTKPCTAENNDHAFNVAKYIYSQSGKGLFSNIIGGNIGPATIKKLDGVNFLFPENSMFYSKDVEDIQDCLRGKTFDAIVLDPPWWNKYIRRKRKISDDGYGMMYSHDLRCIPIETILKDNGLLIIWCTNSEQHFNTLLNDVFPKWNVKYISKWYWLKITKYGEPICKFYEPPGKQPFEKIVFARRHSNFTNPCDDKLVVSVPSALHSHKPPLVDLLNEFLPENPLCLEIFARYLLPGWSSYGNEVLKFQHESLYSCVL